MKRNASLVLQVLFAFLLGCSGPAEDEMSEVTDLDSNVDSQVDEVTVETATEAPNASSSASDEPAYGQLQEAICSGSCALGCAAIISPPPTCTCCLCNGAFGNWKQSAWSQTTYLCR